MGATEILTLGINSIFKEGNNVLVKLINYSFTNSDYDDVLTQTLTGSTWISGIEFPIRGKQGSEEAMLMEQGKLLTKDKILFLNGSQQLNSSGLLIGIGSPTPSYYTIINDGVRTWSLAGSIMYNKLFLRHTIPGSIF